MCRPVVLIALLGVTEAIARADAAVVAVASNFSSAMERLESTFEDASGHQLTVVTGSTGKLYAQIIRGAPFDVLLAADQRRPKLLEAEGFVVSGSRFTFALGQLTLWSPDIDRVGADGVVTLTEGQFRKLAIANPDLAPYGAAAREVLENVGVYDRLAGRLVMGENIGQTYAMVATGNADLALIARSYWLGASGRGSHWHVPEHLHAPIRQDAVLLRRAENNAAARAFLDYLGQTRAVIRDAGYEVD